MNAKLFRALEVVSAVTGEPVHEIMHGGRAWRYCWPRAICMMLMHEAGMSYPAIAQDFGTHHTTALNAVRIVTDECETNKARKREYDKCNNLFKAITGNSADVPKTAAHHD